MIKMKPRRTRVMDENEENKEEAPTFFTVTRPLLTRVEMREKAVASNATQDTPSRMPVRLNFSLCRL